MAKQLDQRVTNAVEKMQNELSNSRNDLEAVSYPFRGTGHFFKAGDGSDFLASFTYLGFKSIQFGEFQLRKSIGRSGGRPKEVEQVPTRRSYRATRRSSGGSPV